MTKEEYRGIKLLPQLQEVVLPDTKNLSMDEIVAILEGCDAHKLLENAKDENTVTVIKKYLKYKLLKA